MLPCVAASSGQAAESSSPEDTEHCLVSDCYWMYLCVMRSDGNTRGSQHISYQVFSTTAVSTTSNLMHSIKSHKQDKCPMTSD